MKRKQLASFKVMTFNFNKNVVEFYDIIPTFVNEIKNRKPYKSGEFDVYKHKPRTKQEVKDLVNRLGHYFYWSKCEWEIVVSSWPTSYDKEKFDSWVKNTDFSKDFTWWDIPDFRNNEQKIDVWSQIEANIDLIVDILCDYFEIQ